MGTDKSDLKLEDHPTARTRPSRELLIFSLDDTLVDTGMYWLARTAHAKVMAARTGQPVEETRLYEASSGVDAITMQATWKAFQKECGLARDSDSRLYAPMASALRRKYPSAIPGAEELVKWADAHFTLALLAVGDANVERQKLEATYLDIYFKAIKVVPSKRPEDYLAVMTELEFSPQNTWVIGGSVSADIIPAIETGANCIHYTCPHPQPNGARDQVEELAETVFRVHDLADAKEILAKPA